MFYSYCILATESTKWTDPTRVSIHVHKVDRPHEGSKFKHVHKMDGPH